MDGCLPALVGASWQKCFALCRQAPVAPPLSLTPVVPAAPCAPLAPGGHAARVGRRLPQVLRAQRHQHAHAAGRVQGGPLGVAAGPADEQGQLGGDDPCGGQRTEAGHRSPHPVSGRSLHDLPGRGRWAGGWVGVDAAMPRCSCPASVGWARGRVWAGLFTKLHCASSPPFPAGPGEAGSQGGGGGCTDVCGGPAGAGKHSSQALPRPLACLPSRLACLPCCCCCCLRRLPLLC
jgi:hypothetical protein